jgi:uncharacterized membrane protein
VGQVVDSSGSCAAFNGSFLFNFQPVHALLWQKGRAVDLGTLGGALNNFAHDINNRGEVVGGSDESGDLTSHPNPACLAELATTLSPSRQRLPSNRLIDRT